MNFKKARKDLKLSLKQAAALSGYGIGTISDLEREGVGSDRLKEKLLEIYGVEKKPAACASCLGVARELADGRAELAGLKKKIGGLL